MPQRCSTLAEFLAGAPEFLTFGEASDALLTVLVQPSPGDSITMQTRFGVPIVTESLIADTNFDIGANEAATAANIASAINDGALAAASSSGATVAILTGNGPIGSLTLSSSNPAALSWSESPMTPGAHIVQEMLDCVCLQINLECHGEKAQCAHRYLTGHFLAMQGGGSGEGGAVASRTIDKLAISFATTTPSDGDLGSTKWGRMYMQLKRTILVLPIVGRLC